MISDNISEVLANIKEAENKAGIKNGTANLIAVSKTKPVEMLKEVYDYGIRDFGENKVQELLDKYEQLPDDIRWHLIGHLQTNKVKYIVGKVFLIHSVDSLKLAKEISKESIKKDVISDVLIEINVAEEDSKFGIKLNEAENLIREISVLPNIRVKGLMTVAPFVDNAEENRAVFSKLNQLFVDIKNKNIDNVVMEIMSMGMSGDYQVAVEEGATYVRVGTNIFGERNYNI